MTPYRRSMILLALVSALMTQTIYHENQAPSLSRRSKLQQEILAGDSASPFQYRVLAPAISHGMMIVGVSFRWSHIVLTFCALFVWLWGSYRYLRWNMAATLLLAVLAAYWMRKFWYHPWSPVEFALFAWGLVWAREGKLKSFLALAVLASLNRQTGIIYPLIWACYQFRSSQPSTWGSSIVAIVAGVGTWAAVQVAQGPVHHMYGVAFIWSRNLERIETTWPIWAVVFVPLIVTWVGRRAPRAWPVAAAYLAIFAIWANWWDLRPILAIMPIALAWTFGGDGESETCPAFWRGATVGVFRC